MFDGDHDGNDGGQVDRRKGPQGQRESTLQSRQPRGCKASVLCISLWMVSTNRLVTCCTPVDERGCGKVDNSQAASLAQVGNLHPPELEGGNRSAAREFYYPSDGHAHAALLLFRCSGCPDQAE